MFHSRISSYFFIALTIIVGVLSGVGIFTLGYGDGLSYLTNDPSACVNCHIMQPQFDSWQKSSHHSVAVCNDCHTPHHPVWKWVTKADNGFFHSLAFTLNDFHEPIQIKPRNRRVTIGTCASCHADVIHQIALTERIEEVMCTRCHSEVGHALR